MKIKVGIPRSLLYYYYKDLWKSFFEYLNIEVVESNVSNKKILEDGEKLTNDEACLSLKLFLGHVYDLKDKCDFIFVPRLFSVSKNEVVCTNFSCIYDLVNNLFDDINILNYNVDLGSHDTELLGFLKIGKELGISYINAYAAYKYAYNKKLLKRKYLEDIQKKKLASNNIKILLAAHPYNLYDELIGKPIIKYLKDNDIEIIYSDRIDHNLIDSECMKISTDIYWTHSKEVMASINYYKNKVDGIIILSSFPCGPDSLSNELAVRKVKNIPILTLIIENLNSDVGIITRLESFIDILKNKKEYIYEKSN